MILLEPFKARIFVLTTSLVLITALSISLFQQMRVEKHVRENELLQSRNTLKLTAAHIENQYASYIFHRESLVKERQNILKATVEIALAAIEDYYQRSQTGEISEKEAMDAAIAFVRKVRYPGGGYLWINTRDKPHPKAISHSIMPEIEGRRMDTDDPLFNRALGKNANLFQAFVEACEATGEGYVDYLWPKLTEKGLSEQQPKISFVKTFKPWNWIIGTGLYIDDIEKDSKLRIDAIIKELRNAFAKTRISANSYLFIFDGNYNLLSHPEYEGKGIQELKNPTAEKLIMKRMKEIAAKPGEFITYKWQKPGDPRPDFFYEKQAFVYHFQPLDWYVVASIYMDELLQPLAKLRWNILAIVIVLLSLSLLLASMLANSLSRPLLQLSKLAQQIETDGLENVEFPVTGTSETIRLGKYLNAMLASLKKAEIERNALFEHGPLGVAYHKIICNEAGEPIDYYYIDANNKFIELTGVDPRGKTVKEVFPDIEKDQFNWIQNYGNAAKTGKQLRFRQFFSITGCWYDGIAFQYKPEHFVVAFLDITEQMKLEQQLHQAQKMDAVGQLAGGIAHDFNNVLGGIIGAAELLSMDLNENDRQKKFVNIIIESSLRATDLIRKLLTFGRLKPLNPVAVDVHTAIREAIALLECSIDKKIKIETRIEAEQSVVSGDLAQLQTVFINLGINASHAMPEGGKISIESNCVDLDEFSAKAHSVEPGRFLKVQFRDTGTGISPEHISRIFEPFFTTKHAGKGSGLGLSASFGIIKQHNGSISVYSELGHGTVFNILLPLSTSAEKEPEIAVTPVKGCGLILLIDDETIIRETATGILKRLGYEVIAASSAQEGITFYNANRDSIKLVLLDMIMPEMNGRECFEQLKKINPDVRVVLASGFSQAADFDQMQKNGLCGFIQKPYSLIELSRLLNKILNKEQQ